MVSVIIPLAIENHTLDTLPVAAVSLYWPCLYSSNDVPIPVLPAYAQNGSTPGAPGADVTCAEVLSLVVLVFCAPQAVKPKAKSEAVIRLYFFIVCP